MNLSACIFWGVFSLAGPCCLRPVASWLPVLAGSQDSQLRWSANSMPRLWLLHHHACQTKWGQSSLCSVMLCCIKVLMVVSLLLNCCKHASRPPPPPRLWTASSPWQSVGKLMRRGGVGFLPSTGAVPGWGCGSNRLIQKKTHTHTHTRQGKVGRKWRRKRMMKKIQ